MKTVSTDQKITQQILDGFASNTIPWRRGYTTSSPSIMLPTRHTSEPYRGINALVLMAQCIRFGYTSPYFITFKQCQSMGGNLKGAKGTRIIKFGRREIEPTQPGEDSKTFAYQKYYTVFNVEQATGLPEQYISSRTVAEPCEHSLHDLAESIGVTILHGFDQGAYYPVVDTIRLPNKSNFKSDEAYAATLAHELVHSTAIKKRLNRTLDRSDEKSVAQEELIAEIGSAMLLARLGIPAEINTRVIPYVASWIAAMSNDPRYILKASTTAQKALDYLLGGTTTVKETTRQNTTEAAA